MKHRGEILEKAIKESKIHVVDIAEYMEVNRGTIYNWQKVPNLSLEILYKIGKFIKHDFSKDFEYSTELEQLKKIEEEQETYGNSNDFKDKYLKLLEEQNKFLREKTLTQESLLLAMDKLINSLSPKKSLDNLGDDLKASMNTNSKVISEKLEMIAQAIAMSH